MLKCIATYSVAAIATDWFQYLIKADADSVQVYRHFCTKCTWTSFEKLLLSGVPLCRLIVLIFEIAHIYIRLPL